jgi:hypothetical protein
MLSDSRGRLVDYRPERAKLPDGVDERWKVDRLYDIGIDAKLVAPNQILFLSRRREHDDRDGFQIIVCLQRTKHIQAIEFGHLQIQQEHGRVACRARRELIPAIEVIECFGAVPHDHDFIREVDLRKRRKRQFDVIRIVFGKNDTFQLGYQVNASVRVYGRPGRLSVFI